MDHLQRARHLVVCFAGRLQRALIAGVALPPPNGHVHIKWIDLDPIADSAHPFGSQQCASEPRNPSSTISPLAELQYCVSNHLYRLHGWVQRQQVTLLALFRHGADARVLPYVGPIAPEFPKLDGIPMWAFGIFENKNQFMCDR